MELVKLTFGAYKTAACKGNPVASIKAFINPESYTHTIPVTYVNAAAIASSNASQAYKGMGPGTLALSKIVVDGTGIVSLGSYANVDAYIKAFRNVVCSYNGDIHRTNFLKIIWGTLNFIGVCTSFKVNYAMFKPDGSALRAVIDLTLQSSVDPITESKDAKRNSPDLTHVRTVQAGDTLPLMTFRIYGDPSYYLEVARINGLKNMYALKPGDQIEFPPLKK